MKTGGELITQKYAGRAFVMSIYEEYVSISLVTPSAHTEMRIPSNLLDNKWHTIEFLYQMGSLKLLIDRKEAVIANATYNSILITDPPNNDAAILLLGTTYSGCMLHGPGLNFSSSTSNAHPILFGPCPLMPGECAQNAQNDVLIRSHTDHCLHEPCMQKGICVSKLDTYEVSHILSSKSSLDINKLNIFSVTARLGIVEKIVKLTRVPRADRTHATIPVDASKTVAAITRAVACRDSQALTARRRSVFIRCARVNRVWMTVFAKWRPIQKLNVNVPKDFRVPDAKWTKTIANRIHAKIMANASMKSEVSIAIAREPVTQAFCVKTMKMNAKNSQIFAWTVAFATTLTVAMCANVRRIMRVSIASNWLIRAQRSHAATAAHVSIERIRFNASVRMDSVESFVKLVRLVRLNAPRICFASVESAANQIAVENNAKRHRKMIAIAWMAAHAAKIAPFVFAQMVTKAHYAKRTSTNAKYIQIFAFMEFALTNREHLNATVHQVSHFFCIFLHDICFGGMTHWENICILMEK